MNTKRIISLLLVLCLILFCTPRVSAADAEFLLNKNGKVITSATTLDEIRQMFGQERLKTESMFGGNAYTFYGENYADYLYIETNSQEKIAAYSTFGSDFTSNAGNAGEQDDMSLGWLSGEKFTDYDNNIWGVTGYCRQNISDIEEVIRRYEGDPKYAIAVIRHTVPMWSAVAKYFGKDAAIQFDESTFYTNRQLMEGGSNLYDYCNEVGRGGAFTLISTNYSALFLYYRATVPNPAMYAAFARNYNVPENAYIVLDYTYGSGMEIVGSLDESFFAPWTAVPYTEHEQQLLNSAREIYAESVAVYNSAETYFVTEPQDETIPLEAGRVHPNIVEGAVGYLNAIRAAADLPLLEHAPGLSEDAQHKAVLTMYIAKNDIVNFSPHEPDQPEGVSDEFYGHAQSSDIMGAYGENLFFGSVQSSIPHALDDGYGDYITCGHRYNLLNPYYTHVGLGESSGQGVHKFSGSRPYDGDIVAWPSKGVMLMESLSRNITTFTVDFYNNYTPTSGSGIIFRCLNTGETITFPGGMENTDSRFLYVNGSIVSYYSNEMSLIKGNVYEITVTNVMDKATGELTDYTYRSVCETASTGTDDPSQAEQLHLDTEELTIGLDATAKISARILPEEVPNRMVRWSSSDEAVATVNENGYVTGHAVGTVIITASTDNGVTKTCTVIVTDACIDHKYTAEVTDPTCAEQGYTTHTCSVCGDSYKDSYTDATGGHTYQNDQDTTCDVCGDVREIRIKTTPMYRLYNPYSGEHFYTGSIEEKDMLVTAGWTYEGIAWNAPVSTGDPVYRLYNPYSGDHHYTMSAEEKDMLVGVGWKYEGVAWNSAAPDNLPLYRLYNPYADCGSHHYTGSTEERDNLVAVGWIYEGIGWFGMLK